MKTLLTALQALYAPAFAQPPFYRAFAPKPPMGWNSWDYFGTSITEEQSKAQADAMALQLKPYGWNFVPADATFPFRFRHGSPLAITAAEAARLRAAFPITVPPNTGLNQTPMSPPR